MKKIKMNSWYNMLQGPQKEGCYNDGDYDDWKIEAKWNSFKTLRFFPTDSTEVGESNGPLSKFGKEFYLFLIVVFLFSMTLSMIFLFHLWCWNLILTPLAFLQILVIISPNIVENLSRFVAYSFGRVVIYKYVAISFCPWKNP